MSLLGVYGSAQSWTSNRVLSNDVNIGAKTCSIMNTEMATLKGLVLIGLHNTIFCREGRDDFLCYSYSKFHCDTTCRAFKSGYDQEVAFIEVVASSIMHYGWRQSFILKVAILRIIELFLRHVLRLHKTNLIFDRLK